MSDELFYFAYGYDRKNKLIAFKFAGLTEANEKLTEMLDDGVKFAGVTPAPCTEEQFRKPSDEKGKMRARLKAAGLSSKQIKWKTWHQKKKSKK